VRRFRYLGSPLGGGFVEDAVHKQQEHGSQYRHDHPGSRAVAVWSDEPAKEGGDECSGDAEQDGDNKTARISAGRQELSDGSTIKPIISVQSKFIEASNNRSTTLPGQIDLHS